jgi:hypothetical protein
VRCILLVTGLALLGSPVAAEAPDGAKASLVVLKDGTRHRGVLTVEGDRLTCGVEDGARPIPMRLADVAEIVGPHAELVSSSQEERLARRVPDPRTLLWEAARPLLEGDPECLERMLADKHWEFWCPPTRESRSLARDLRRHLRGITNRMKAFFPRGEKPGQPLRVRVFGDTESFLAWRNRLEKHDPVRLLTRATVDFYVGPEALMLADLRACGVVADRVPEYSRAARAMLEAARNEEQLAQALTLLTALAVACVSGEEAIVRGALHALLQYSPPRQIGGGSGTASPLPDEDATFIHLGYYARHTEELVVWASDQMWSTLSHEGFHYWLQHNCPEAPIWVNEGFATYFETFSPRQRSEYQGFHFDRHEELKMALEAGAGLVPLEQLLVLPIEVWQGQPGPMQSFLYAQSWAFIHFLLHSEEYDFGNKGEKLLKRYLTSLAEGATPEEARDEHFSGDNALDKLEPRFHYYVSRLKRPDKF